MRSLKRILIQSVDPVKMLSDGGKDEQQESSSTASSSSTVSGQAQDDS